MTVRNVNGARCGAAYDRLTWLAVTIGAVLRTMQYARGASVWVDEAAIARVIVGGSFASFVHPLPFVQVAPPLFLVLERLCVALFGPGERALRLLPFVCSLLALPMVVRIARRLLPPSTAWISVLMFSIGAPFVFFGSDLKPYSGDVLAGLIAADVVTAVDELDVRSGGRIAALGLLAWVSHAAILMLAGIGVALAVVHARTGARARRALVAIAIAWAVMAGPAVYLAVRNVTPATSAYLHRFWIEAFPPLRPKLAAYWAWDTASSLIGNPSSHDPLDGALHYSAWWIVGALSLAGVVRLTRTAPNATLLMFAPAVATLAAAAAHAYPFTGRFVVFVLPPVLVAVGAGIAACGRAAGSRFGTVVATATVIVVCLVAAARTLPPQLQEDITPIMTHLRGRPSTEPIYVYYGAGQAFLFYAPQFGLDAARYKVGKCARGRLRQTFDELDGLRGARSASVVFSHVMDQDEHARTLEYLGSAGHELGAVFGSGRNAASAHLYDFTDTARWDRARRMVRPTPDAPERWWECDGPISAVATR
jgi:hypothetical protein